MALERDEGWITLGGDGNIMSLRACICAAGAHGLFDRPAHPFSCYHSCHRSTYLFQESGPR